LVPVENFRFFPSSKGVVHVIRNALGESGVSDLLEICMFLGYKGERPGGSKILENRVTYYMDGGVISSNIEFHKI
jgi:hypothetical protein